MRLNNLEGRVFLGLVLATTAFFLWMMRDFLMPVFWAVVFAVLFRPIYLRTLRAVKGRPNVAALLTTIAVILVVVIPTTVLVTAVARQAMSLYARAAAGELNLDAPIGFIERTLPQLMEVLERLGVNVEQARTGVETAAVSGTQWIASLALSAGQNALTITIMFALMLYLLFFFFRDGDRILQAVIRALPMGDVREERLFNRFAQVSRATVKGTLIVAAVQGALGGVLFALLGIQAAVFWGVVMGVLSLLPAVGPALVWVPMSILLFSTGEIGKGLIMFAGGAIVVGLVDNLLRPILVGREAKLPDYLVLLGTLGGLTVFGIAGFVAGPIIAALFLVMWEMFSEEYAPLDSSEIAATSSDTVIASLAESVTGRPVGGVAAAEAETIWLEEAALRAGPSQTVEVDGVADSARKD